MTNVEMVIDSIWGFDRLSKGGWLSAWLLAHCDVARSSPSLHRAPLLHIVLRAIAIPAIKQGVR